MFNENVNHIIRKNSDIVDSMTESDDLISDLDRQINQKIEAQILQNEKSISITRDQKQ